MPFSEENEGEGEKSCRPQPAASSLVSINVADSQLRPAVWLAVNFRFSFDIPLATMITMQTIQISHIFSYHIYPLWQLHRLYHLPPFLCVHSFARFCALEHFQCFHANHRATFSWHLSLAAASNAHLVVFKDLNSKLSFTLINPGKGLTIIKCWQAFLEALMEEESERARKSKREQETKREPELPNHSRNETTSPCPPRAQHVKGSNQLPFHWFHYEAGLFASKDVYTFPKWCLFDSSI